MVFLYLSTVIPSIWFLELNQLQFKLPINSSSPDLLLLSHIPIAAVGVFMFHSFLYHMKCTLGLCDLKVITQHHLYSYWPGYERQSGICPKYISGWSFIPSIKKSSRRCRWYLMLSYIWCFQSAVEQCHLNRKPFVLYCQHCHLIRAKVMILPHFHDHLLLFFSL